MQTQKTHLQYVNSDRGFKFLPPVTDNYGARVKVYESSSAEHPHIWLKAESPENPNFPGENINEAYLHLTVEKATELAEQLLYLVENHYQEPENFDSWEDDEDEQDDWCDDDGYCKDGCCS